jgi:tetratricopeptide (TPR) repeat protein
MAPEPAPPAVADEPRLADAVRQMTEILAAEQAQRTLPTAAAGEDALTRARRQAQEFLAEEIFREEKDEDILYGRQDGGLSKLERDALIGQGIDFESRHQRRDAISCYEQAVSGGLTLPAAFFNLGMLYLEEGETESARRYLRLAAIDPQFRRASEIAATQLRTGGLGC